jgi:exodeoxyribonuclease VII small subunit
MVNLYKGKNIDGSQNMPKKKVKTDYGPEHFDELLAKLRSIVEEMEKGGAGLEESLRMFEEGIDLSQRLFDILNKTEGKVEELLANMEKVAFSGPELEG